MKAIITWTLVITLLWNKQVMSERENEIPSLDQMNCFKSASHQISKRASMVRRVNYDLVGLLTLLLRMEKELSDLGVEEYEFEPELIQLNSMSKALLMGSRLAWTRCNSSLITSLSPDHRLILDFVRIVTDKVDKQGLCLMGEYEFSYSLCEESLTASIENLKTKWNLILKPPKADVDEERLGQSEILLASKNALFWSQPDSAESYRFLIKKDHVSELVLHVKSLVTLQIKQMVSSLNIFLVYVKESPGCNYFIRVALSALNRSGDLFSDTLSDGEAEEKIELECRKLTQGIIGQTRQHRGLLSWLFSDQGETLSRLISAQHQAVKADEILMKNQRRLNTANDVLTRNLNSLRDVESNNSKVLLEMLITTQTRETLHHVEHLLREEKLALVSMLRGMGNQLNIMMGEFKGLMQRLVDDLSPNPQCSLDGSGRGVACSSESAYVDSLEDGVLHLASGADLYQSANIFMFHCLYLPENHYGSRFLFTGNREGFLRADGFFHNKNLSVPEQCFKDPKSTDFRCKKFIAQYYEGSIIKPPLQYGPINYILGGDLVYVQSTHGTISISFRSGKTVPLGNTPLLIERKEFPIFADSRKITFSDLSLTEDIKTETEFFIQNIDSSYFDFKLPIMKIPHLSNVGDWSYFLDETEQLFSQSPTFQALSITSIIVACGFCGCLLFGIFVCCRRRNEEKALIQVLYERVRYKEGKENPPGPKPKPKSPVGASNRDQYNTWLDKLRGKKNKQTEMSADKKDETLLPSEED